MGRAKRTTPSKLGEKLAKIRQKLDLTIDEIIEELDCPEIPLHPASISMYESGKREPPLIILLRYARLAKVSMESLVDDEIDL
jgi:transcriptional regulator with XRE-family HTH domain